MKRWVILLACVPSLALAGCGDSDGDSTPAPARTEVGWVEGMASATLEIDGEPAAVFEGGTCRTARTSTGVDSFRLTLGEPGANGEGLIVALGLDLGPGASFEGDGSGNGIQVDHAGTRWRLAAGENALLFDDDLAGGTIRVSEQGGGREAIVKFRCA